MASLSTPSRRRDRYSPGGDLSRMLAREFAAHVGQSARGERDVSLDLGCLGAQRAQAVVLVGDVGADGSLALAQHAVARSAPAEAQAKYDALMQGLGDVHSVAPVVGASSGDEGVVAGFGGGGWVEDWPQRAHSPLTARWVSGGRQPSRRGNVAWERSPSASSPAASAM